MPITEKGFLPQTGCLKERLHAPGELVGRQAHDVLLVEPLQLFRTKDGVAAADAVERKSIDQLVFAKQLAVAGAGRPSEQPEKVDHRFGKKALGRIFHDGRRAVTLAQTLLVRAENQRHVRELRHGRPQRAVQQDVLRRIRDVIVSAHHMRDRHLHVV